MSFLLLPSFFQTRPTQHTSPSGSEPAAFLRPHVQEPLWRRRPTAPALYTRHRDRDILVGGWSDSLGAGHEGGAKRPGAGSRAYSHLGEGAGRQWLQRVGSAAGRVHPERSPCTGR